MIATPGVPVPVGLRAVIGLTAAGRSSVACSVACILAAAWIGAPISQAQEVLELTARDRLIEPDFDEVYRVGVLDGESWEMFGRVNRVAFDAEGNLYVFEGTMGLTGPKDLRVLVFDAAGGFIREFGSWGGGPGEFSQPTGFAVLRDGTTVVSDAGHRAYQLFHASGVFLRQVRAGGVSFPGGIEADPRGGAVFAGSFAEGGLSVRIGSAGTKPTSRPVMRVGLGDQVAQTDTVVQGWLPPRTDAELPMPNNAPAEIRNMLGMSLPTVFEPKLLVGFLPDGGIVHSDSSAYVLKVTSPGSREVARVIRRPLLPEPLTPTVRREYEERRAAAREERGGVDAVQNRMREIVGRLGPLGSDSRNATVTVREPNYYPEIPVLRGLAATWGGRIWVQRRGELPESDGPVDVVTVAGEYVGTYRTGATKIPDAFGPDGLAAFIEFGELDVPRVVVRRLPTAVR